MSDISVTVVQTPITVFLPAPGQAVTVQLPGVQGPQGTVGPPGATGPAGGAGPAGPGVSVGGTTGQVLEKASGADFDTIWATPAAGGVTSFNTRTGDIVLASADVTGALGFTDLARTGVANSFVGGQSITSAAIGTVGVTVRAALGQTANLHTWQDSTGATVAGIQADGSQVLGATAGSYRFTINGASRNGAFFGIPTASAVAGDILNFGNVTNAISGTLNGFVYNASCTGDFINTFANTNSTSTGANCYFESKVASANSGDPKVMFTISGVLNCVVGLDNSDSDKFKISRSNLLGGSDALTITTTGTTTLISLAATSQTLLVRGAASQTAPLAQLMGQSSTTTREQADIDTAWVVSTDATRKARLVLRAWDTAAREVMRGEGDGANPLVGFLGAAAVARQTVTGSRGANAALASLLTALAALGLITDSTTV